MKKKKIINLFEAFSGIWSQHEALKKLNMEINNVWISEWYIDALLSYWLYHLKLKIKNINRQEVLDKLSNYTFSKNSKEPAKNLNNITDDKLSILEQIIDMFWELDINKITWKELVNKDIDLFTYSFPCQDISQQWKQKWFAKWTDSRSGLLWQIERILKEMKEIDSTKLPKVLLMENVKAIIGKNFKEDLNEWVLELENIWYVSSKPFILNSSKIGSAQNRDRVFLISVLKDTANSNNIQSLFSSEQINIDLDKNTKWQIQDIFQKNMKHDIFTHWDKKIIYNHRVNKKENSIKKWFLENYTTFNSENYFYYLDWQSPTITSTWAQSRIKVWDKEQIIYLNAYEHLLLQWFNNKELYIKMKEIWLSETKIKFLAWNSINVDVLTYIFNKVIQYV